MKQDDDVNRKVDNSDSYDGDGLEEYSEPRLVTIGKVADVTLGSGIGIKDGLSGSLLV